MTVKNMDKELRKAFEETTRNNVNAVIEYSQTTRKMVRDFETKINSLDGTVRAQETIIKSLQMQIANLQTKIFSGGTS